MTIALAHIYTDGASKVVGPRGPSSQMIGGWGVHAILGSKIEERSGHELGATNNRMELMAIRQGIILVKELGSRVERAIIYSDSTYSVNAVSVWHFNWRKNGWRTAAGTPVLNRELIEEITGDLPENIALRWIKGHAKNPGNERADELAGEARKFLEEGLTL